MKIFDVKITEKELLALYPEVGDCYKSDTTQYYIKVLETKDKVIKLQEINMYKTATSINIEVNEIYRLFLDKNSTLTFVYPLVCKLIHKIPTEEYDTMYNKINDLIC